MDDAVELGALLSGRRGHVGRVDHEALAFQIEDPETVDLAGALLVAVARPARCRPALEVTLVAAREFDLARANR